MAADLGTTIKVRVSFTDDASNAETLTSAATAAVSAAPNTPATGAPTITGTAQVGQTLTAGTTAIVDADGLTRAANTRHRVSYTYQWIRVATDNTETNISGATASTHTLVAADLGTTIKVRVSFTDDASNAETLTSAATAAVSAAPNTPATGAPTITGTAQVGQTLTAGTTAIVDADGLTSVSYTYQWIRVATDNTETNISGATASTHTLVAADLGTTIKVRVSFTDDASNAETLTSAATAVVSAAADTTPPTLTSATILVSGQIIELQLSENVQRSNLPLVSAFTVTADGSAVTLTLVLVPAALDTYWISVPSSSVIRQGQVVVVTYTDPTTGDDTAAIQDTAGNDALDFTTDMDGVPAVTNNSTVNTPATGAPTITGTAQVGQTLTAGTTAIMDRRADQRPATRTSGSGHTNISGATASTYTLVAADLGTTIKVRVSFTDDASNAETRTSAATAAVSATAAVVPANWSLKPTGRAAGDQFRLLFLSSTKRNGSSTDIATYNTFVQERAAAGHADIRTYSAGFRAVGCTSDVDARDNTRTTGTGVPIYWLNGAKAADNYADFYDGSWDDEVNDKNESGTNGPDTSQSVNRPFTGCEHNGTEALDGSISQGFGAAGGTKVGRPNSSSALHGPLSSNAVTGTANTRPLYGLSEVFQVAAAVVVPNNPPAFSADTAARSVAENTAAGQNVGAALTATDADSDTLTYTLEGTDAASFDIVSGSGQIRTRTGVTYNHEAKSTHTVVVKADDGNGGTDTVTVTITVTDVDEPPGQPAAPSVSATAGSTTSLDVTWTAPTNTGPAIASYDLQYRAGTSGNFTNGPQNVTGTSAAIGSLAADTSYEVQVRATNAEGDGDWSVAGTGRTTATSAPGAPTGLTATASGATQIDLSWSAPAITGGSAITGYNIEVSPNGTSGWTDQVANTNSTATTYAHTGLAASTTRHYRVSAINTIGTSAASNVDDATTGAGTNTAATGAPTITGTAQVGQTLTAVTTAIMDAEGLTTVGYTYQWIRTAAGVDTNISGATASTYTLVAADLGTTIKVRVSFTDDASNDETLTSAATAAVAAAPNTPATGAPTITGTAQVGQTLTAGTTAIMDADGLTNVSYTYQWIRVDGGTETNISGATASTYTLVAADQGKTIKVRVSFTDDASNAETLTSTATAVVSAAPNTLPSASDGTVTTNEDTARTFAAADFNFLDTDPGDTLSNVRIVTLPASGKGTLALSGTPVTANQVVAATNIGTLTYTPPANANGTGYASFTFKVSDGTAESAADYTMTITVTAVNDAPTVATAIPDQPATAGTAFSYAFPANTFSDADIGDTLTYAATKADGATLPAWLSFAAGTRTFSGTPQAADIGTVAVKVTASDGNGGSVSDTFDITVSAAGDTTPPTLTSATVFEGGVFINLQFSENMLQSNLPSTDTFTVTAAGSAVTVYTVQPAVFPAAPPNAFWILVRPTIQQGQVVVVTYTDPTAGDDANAIQNTAGNDAATFTTGMDGVPAVTNNSITNTPATGAPTITGTATVGQTLTAVTTGIMDADGLTNVSYTYQWIRVDGGADISTNISGATSITYTLVGADLGKTIKVKVSFTDDASNPETLTSTATAAVAAAANTPATGAPAITGAAQVGQTLTAGTTAIMDANGLTSVSYTYQWIRVATDNTETNIASATASTYTLVAADQGTTIKVKVSFTDDASNAETLTSAATAAVAAAVPNNPPAFSADTAARSVAENTAAGQNVGAALTATDADSDTLTYTLEGTDAASFDIVSGSGQIRTRTGVTYNHEAKSTHTVVVKADDGNGGTDTVTVTITVTDVDEPPGRPAAPTVSATAGSTTSLDVTWTAPTNTGPAIASYDLQYRAGTSGNFTNGPQNVTGTSAAAIGSLAADTSYEVQVRATNAEGDGDWSVAGTGRTTATSAPGAPTGLTATASGTTAINLSWSAPASTGGSAITGYNIESPPMAARRGPTSSPTPTAPPPPTRTPGSPPAPRATTASPPSTPTAPAPPPTSTAPPPAPPCPAPRPASRQRPAGPPRSTSPGAPRAAPAAPPSPATTSRSPPMAAPAGPTSSPTRAIPPRPTRTPG